MVASVASMIGSFNRNNIAIMQDMGYEVHVACNFKDISVWPKDRIKDFVRQLNDIKVHYHQVDFSRSPKNVKKVGRSFLQVDTLVSKFDFDFVHCHTPLASAIVRVICHRRGVKVIYTAHGFHFYNGAPLKSWMFYYPVEKILSRWTDVLITINKEDYRRAKKKFHAKRTVYVPGVGVDTKKFAPSSLGRKKIRAELGISEERTVLLSVGELNSNKNHEAVIRAINGLNLTYIIVGQGELAEYLSSLATKMDVDLHLMGFRSDVSDFYDAADVYVLPSIREGLNVSLMEAMASGLPCFVGKIRGNTDLIDEMGGYFIDPKNILEIRHVISRGKENCSDMGAYNLKKISKYDARIVNKKISGIYAEIAKCSCFYE